MPSSRSSRRTAAITNRQRSQPRASTREIGPDDRDAPVVALPPELADLAVADRVAPDARRAAIRTVIREVEQRKRQARRDNDTALLERLDRFARQFDAAMRRAGSLDRFPS